MSGTLLDALPAPYGERFVSKIHVSESGCWEWTASRFRTGYAQFRFNGTMVRAHRLAYIAIHGEPEEGLDLDHLCRVRHCVNPAHLEPVTRSENNRRGLNDPGALHRDKTHCPQGHPYDKANTYVRIRDGRPRRQCIACMRERTRVWRARKAAA